MEPSTQYSTIAGLSQQTYDRLPTIDLTGVEYMGDMSDYPNSIPEELITETLMRPINGLPNTNYLTVKYKFKMLKSNYPGDFNKEYVHAIFVFFTLNKSVVDSMGCLLTEYSKKTVYDLDRIIQNIVIRPNEDEPCRNLNATQALKEGLQKLIADGKLSNHKWKVKLDQ